MPEPLRTTKETHPNLPPGLILDKDGKVCKACNSWQDWGKMKIKKKPAPASSSSSSSASSSSSTAPSSTSSNPAALGAAGAGTAAAVTTLAKDRSSCPPDTAELGRATWTFLHTTAAYYPLKPSTSQQTQMRALLSSLPALYPCTWCADDFGADMKANAPDVSGRQGLSKWLCERHNEVNRKLGKKEFGCDWQNLDARWKDGPADGSCD